MLHILIPFVEAADRSSSGLLEFEDVGDALVALMLCNHAGIQSPGRWFDLMPCNDAGIQSPGRCFMSVLPLMQLS
jgi:hypothetical protein